MWLNLGFVGLLFRVVIIVVVAVVVVVVAVIVACFLFAVCGSLFSGCCRKRLCEDALSGRTQACAFGLCFSGVGNEFSGRKLILHFVAGSVHSKAHRLRLAKNVTGMKRNACVCLTKLRWGSQIAYSGQISTKKAQADSEKDLCGFLNSSTNLHQYRSHRLSSAFQSVSVKTTALFSVRYVFPVHCRPPHNLSFYPIYCVWYLFSSSPPSLSALAAAVSLPTLRFL